MEKIRQKLLILSVSMWNYIFILLILLLIGLILGSLLSKEWVVTALWSGGILRANSGEYSGLHYSDLNCEQDCIFKDLQKGGVLVIIFDLLSLMTFLVWLTALVYKTKGVEILKAWKKYVVPTFAVIFHWVAICAWGGVTQITFNGGRIYSSTGPALAVSASVISPLVAALYIIIEKESIEEINVPNMESIRVEGRHKWTEKRSIEEEENRN